MVGIVVHMAVAEIAFVVQMLPQGVLWPRGIWVSQVDKKDAESDNKPLRTPAPLLHGPQIL